MRRILAPFVMAFLLSTTPQAVAGAEPVAVPPTSSQEAPQGTGVCDIQVSVQGGALADDNVTVRLGQDLAVFGAGYPPTTTLTIEFYFQGYPPDLYETLTSSAGSFEEHFIFTGDDPPEPESWLLTVYVPDDVITCIDWVNLWVIEATPFTDISSSAFGTEIAWLFQSGITTGCTATTFCPKGTVTREQMASFLARALELPAAITDHFTDDETSMHEDNINRIADAAITTGCTATKFCPKGTVTREQMASFLARALELPPATKDYFSDDETSMHEDNINRLADAGITTGCTATTYCPKSGVTREQMAAFLYRALAE